MPAAKQITSWSYSRYSAYAQCPFKAKLTMIDRLKEPQNAAMERGAKMHDDAEAYIKGQLRTLSKDLKPAKKELDQLKKLFKGRIKLGTKGMAPVIEDMWAFTRAWGLTRWNDWTACWVRIKLDAGWWESPTRFRIRDWKSGKLKEDSSQQYLEQLELYALGAFLAFEQCEEVVPDLYYIDVGVSFPTEPIVYKRSDLPRLKKAWEKRTKQMLADKTFAPRPGWYCQGCYFNKSTEYGYGKNKQSKPAGPCKF